MDYSPPSDENELTSSDWSVPTRFFVLVLVVAGGIWLAVLVAPLLQAVGIAVLLALLLNPLVRWGMRRLRRGWAAAIVFTLFCAILLGITIGMGSLAINQIADIGADLSAAATELQEWLLQPIHVLGYRLEPTSLLTNFETLLNDTLATLPRGSLNFLSAITTNLLWIMTVFVMLYYLLKDGPLLRPWLMERLPSNQRGELSILFDRIEEIWGRFLRIQLLLFFVLVVLLLLGTLLVVWLFRSGLLRWSPLGFILLLLAVYTAVQQVDNLWLRPQYMGRHLQLHPAIVFISLIAGLAFGGLLGVFRPLLRPALSADISIIRLWTSPPGQNCLRRETRAIYDLKTRLICPLRRCQAHVQVKRQAQALKMTMIRPKLNHAFQARQIESQHLTITLDRQKD